MIQFRLDLSPAILGKETILVGGDFLRCIVFLAFGTPFSPTPLFTVYLKCHITYFVPRPHLVREDNQYSENHKKEFLLCHKKRVASGCFMSELDKDDNNSLTKKSPFLEKFVCRAYQVTFYKKTIHIWYESFLTDEKKSDKCIFLLN